MKSGFMGFLYEAGVIRGYFRRIFRGSGDRAAAASGHRDANHPQGAGSLKGADDIGRITARAQTQGDVSRSSVRLNLAPENFLVRIIVPDGGESARIAAEANCGEGSAISQEAAYEFTREVHGERGASAIAEGNDFLIGFQAFDDGAADIVYLPGEIALCERFVSQSAFGQEFLCRWFQRMPLSSGAVKTVGQGIHPLTCNLADHGPNFKG